MCLLVMLSRVDDEAPLVVAANRDERAERPAQAMTVLSRGSPRILGGRDDLAGGTWLAINGHGVVAGLTNGPLDGGPDPSKRSRGELPLSLARWTTAAEAVERLVKEADASAYNPCWLLVGDRSSLYFLDMTSGRTPLAEALPPGSYVLENSPLTKATPKTEHVAAQLHELAAVRGEGLLTALHSILTDHAFPANCVHLDGFGTRSSLLARIPRGDDDPIEVSYTEGPPCTSKLIGATGLWEQ